MNRERSLRIVNNSRGFTLIELVVVMIIIGLLATMVGPRVFKRIKMAKQNSAYAQIGNFGAALDGFRIDVGRYPTSSEGLDALLSRPSGADDWDGPYLKKMEIPLDPWDNPYQYESPGNHGDYDLYSYGADESEGGDGENMDIVSWRGLKKNEQ